tara:strand:+ start:1004 stop:2734 length:1731 start_codon:yes stop_codon:yes gene_type:complete
MFTKDFTRPEPVRPMIPDSLRHTVQAAQDAGRRAEERANLDMPFRARLRARDGVRPQSTLAIITSIENQPRTASAPPRGPTRPLRAVSANPGFLPLGKAGKGGGLSGGSNDDDDGSSRLADISQLAFAGLAVLGLAGLSVMAAESALNGGGDGDPGPLAELPPTLNPGGGAASSAAMAAASTPVDAAPTAWFDYRRLADTLAANKTAYETAQSEAAAAELEQARVQAATAIAETEARRIAEAAEQDAAAQEARLAAAEQEKTRLAEAEAARVAEAEQVRLANLKAEQDAAAAIEAKRLADLEARRLAEAEAETQRLADLKAKADAKAEQKRLAALAAENQKKRIAAAAAEESRLAAITASAVAAPVNPAPRAASPSPKPRRVRQMVAHSGPVPAPATLKPERVGVTLMALATPTVPAYTQSAPSIRPFDTTSRPVSAQAVDEFVAERVELTASQALDSSMVNVLKADFLNLVETQQDGTTQILRTPDGRTLSILIERSLSHQASKASVREITHDAPHSDFVVRFVTEIVPMKVSVICRDVAYALPGQERGRFAACQSPTGGWVLARASDLPAAPEA